MYNIDQILCDPNPIPYLQCLSNEREGVVDGEILDKSIPKFGFDFLQIILYIQQNSS